MKLEAVDHCASVIALEKGGKRYGMCCAWAMNADYDRVVCLIGSQSTTGRAIAKGDVVGFSNLLRSQAAIAAKLGDGHSDSMDKFEGIDIDVDGGAITIPGSRVVMKCQVIDVLSLPGQDGDRLVYMQILDGVKNGGDALRMSDLRERARTRDSYNIPMAITVAEGLDEDVGVHQGQRLVGQDRQLDVGRNGRR